MNSSFIYNCATCSGTVKWNGPSKKAYYCFECRSAHKKSHTKNKRESKNIQREYIKLIELHGSTPEKMDNLQQHWIDESHLGNKKAQMFLELIEHSTFTIHDVPDSPKKTSNGYYSVFDDNDQYKSVDYEDIWDNQNESSIDSALCFFKKNMLRKFTNNMKDTVKSDNPWNIQTKSGDLPKSFSIAESLASLPSKAQRRRQYMVQ